MQTTPLIVAMLHGTIVQVESFGAPLEGIALRFLDGHEVLITTDEWGDLEVVEKGVIDA